MTTRTWLIIGGVGVGGMCLFGVGALALLGLAADEDAASTGPSATSAGGGDRPTGEIAEYRLAGEVKPIQNGYADSLQGQWLMMDGATVNSIESIMSDYVVLKSRRSGELFHYKFSGDEYLFTYVVAANGISANWRESGTWSSDGNTLTLNPESCVERGVTEKNDCALEPRSFALVTVEMIELKANEGGEAHWVGLRLAGAQPSWVGNRTQLDLQHVAAE